MEVIFGEDFTIVYSGQTIAYATDFDFQIDKQSVEVNVLGGGDWKRKKVHMKEWSLSANGIVTRDSLTGDTIDAQYIIQQVKNNDEPVTIAAKLDTAGDSYEEGTGYIVSFKESGTAGEKSTFSISIEGDGGLTTQTVA